MMRLKRVRRYQRQAQLNVDEPVTMRNFDGPESREFLDITDAFVMLPGVDAQNIIDSAADRRDLARPASGRTRVCHRR